MVDMTKKHYVSNKEKFTSEFLEKLYSSKIIVDGFPIYTNFPDRLLEVMASRGINFTDMMQESKISGKKSYAAMQYQLYDSDYEYVVIAFLFEKFAYCYVFNVTEPKFSEAGTVWLNSVVSSAKKPF